MHRDERGYPIDLEEVRLGQNTYKGYSGFAGTISDPGRAGNRMETRQPSELSILQNFEWTNRDCTVTVADRGSTLARGDLHNEGPSMLARRPSNRLDALGVTTIEIMPIAAISGFDGNWGYDGVYRLPFKTVRNSADGRCWVDAAIAGLAVALDVVLQQPRNRKDTYLAHMVTSSPRIYTTPWGAALKLWTDPKATTSRPPFSSETLSTGWKLFILMCCGSTPFTGILNAARYRF